MNSDSIPNAAATGRLVSTSGNRTPHVGKADTPPEMKPAGGGKHAAQSMA